MRDRDFGVGFGWNDGQRAFVSNLLTDVKETYPSQSALRKEALLLRQLSDFAKRRSHTQKSPVIAVPIAPFNTNWPA